jgi:hypothetical protein
MNKYIFTWTQGVSDHAQGGHLKNFVWNDIFNKLNEINGNPGTLSLELIEGPEIGPQLLQIQTERGRYIVSLTEDDEEDSMVRSFINPAGGDQKIDILGNYWPETTVCDDFSMVIKLFKEFYETGHMTSEFLV